MLEIFGSLSVLDERGRLPVAVRGGLAATKSFTHPLNPPPSRGELLYLEVYPATILISSNFLAAIPDLRANVGCGAAIKAHLQIPVGRCWENFGMTRNFRWGSKISLA